MLEKLKNGIYRVVIPFDNIYTTSFILCENNSAIILDSGNSNEDADNYIIPSINELGLTVKYLVSSHTHQDHHGGIDALRKAFPDAVAALISKTVENSLYLTDGDVLLNRYKILYMPGHTDDSLGILDTKTKTLLSCDSLQLYGVGNYPTYIEHYDEYIHTIEIVRSLDIDTIIASHDYEPCGFIATGKKDIDVYLDKCIAVY